MRIASLVVCTLLACGGCGSKKTAGAKSGEGTPCTQEIALVCPDGQIDACLKATAAAPETKSEGDKAGGTGTAMALDEGRMSKLEAAGNHRCVAK